MSKLNISKHNLAIFILLLSTLIFAIAAGINIVSLPFIIYEKSVPTSLMGVSSATEICGGILIAGFLHSLSSKIGAFRLLIIFAVLNAMVILIIFFYQNFALWLLLIFFSGMSWFCLVTLRQSWINNIIQDEKRARIMGISNSVMCIGLTVGPIIVKIVGAGNYSNFIISAGLLLSSGLILLPIKKHQPQIEKLLFENKIFQVIKTNYRIFLARFLLDFQAIIMVIFAVAYGISHHYSAENSGLLVSAYMLIGIFDFLIGFLINDKFYKKYFYIGYLGCFASIIILSLTIKYYYVALLNCVVYGWFSSLIYIAGLSAINSNQKKGNAVAVNAAFQFSGSAGAFTGVLSGGILMQIMGSSGFIVTIALSSLTYLTINFLTIYNEKN